MATATSRRKATKKQTKKKNGRKTTKKPKWTVVSYKKIEAKRAEFGFSKSAMAEILGVTNSTYHNWRRGTTVPHPNQQDAIKVALDNLSAGASTRIAAKAPRVPTKARKASGTGRKARGDVAGGTQSMQPSINGSHPLFPASGSFVPDVTQITTAFISAQKKAPSAGSVYAFVRGLRAVLSE